jgi:hypothetical protein
MSGRINFNKDSNEGQPSMSVVHGRDDGNDVSFYQLFINILDKIAPVAEHKNDQRGYQVRAVLSALAMLSLKDEEEYEKACMMVAVMASTQLSDAEFPAHEAPEALVKMREKMMELQLEAKKAKADEEKNK